ncbi:MAG: hypothetical protein ACE5IG_07965, partial [Dehalococcoidia bacterium]
MHARLIYANLSLYPDTWQRVENFFKSVKGEVKKVAGLKSYTLFTDRESADVGAFLLWESKEAEAAAWEQVKDKVTGPALDIMFRGRPLFKLFEVYEHGAGSGEG